MRTPVAYGPRRLPFGVGGAGRSALGDMRAKTTKGRPSKKTPERMDAIVRRIASGCSREVAARAEGICDETLYAWMRSDSEFSDRVHAADSVFESDAVDRIFMAGSRDWKAYAHLLACKVPERWSVKTRSDVNVTGALTITAIERQIVDP